MATSSASASGARQVVKVDPKPKAKPGQTTPAAVSKLKSFLKLSPRSKEMDQTIANLLKPPRTLLYEDPIGKRFRGFYTVAGTKCRLSEQCLISVGVTEAWVTASKFAWEEYCKDFPQETCPWDCDAIK